MANVLVVFLFLTFALKSTTREDVGLTKRDDPIVSTTQQQLRLIIQVSSGI